MERNAPAAAGVLRSKPCVPASGVEIERLFRFWSAPATTFEPLPLMEMERGASDAAAALAAVPALELSLTCPAVMARDEAEACDCGPERINVPVLV